MNDRMIAEVVQRTLVSAGALLSLDLCPTETRMRIALGVEGAMEALWPLVADYDLSRDIDDVRRAAHSAARLYGRQYAEEMTVSA